MPILQITKDGVLLQELEIQAECITIGREASNDIRLADLTVSRRHGQLRREAGGRYYVENLQSHNGIRLNGHEISQPTALTDGDQLKIGAYQLLFRHSAETTTTLLQAADGAARRKVVGKSSAVAVLPAISPSTTVQPVAEKKTTTPTLPRAEEAEAGILINEASNAIFKLDRDHTVLGNEGQVDIRIPGPERTRATIARRGEYFYLCSETPAPCVFVNGRPVMNARLLYNDQIEIGGRKFIFREI